MSRREEIVRSLADKEYRDAMVKGEIDTGIEFQIRGMREARGWTQTDVASRAHGLSLQQVRQIETPDHNVESIRILRRLASAFDVALIVRFVPFSELADYMADLPADYLTVPEFKKDEGLYPKEE